MRILSEINNITGKKGAKSYLYTFFTIPIAICGGESVVVAGDGALGRGLVIVGRVVGIGCEYGNWLLVKKVFESTFIFFSAKLIEIRVLLRKKVLEKIACEGCCLFFDMKVISCKIGLRFIVFLDENGWLLVLANV